VPDGDTRVVGPDDAWLCSAVMTDLTSDRLPTDRADALTASWELALRAERKSPATIKVYRDGVQRYLTWCTAHGAEPMDRTSLDAWVACLLDAGAAPGTARIRQLAVRRFTAWLIAAGYLAADPFLGVRAPKLDQRVVDPLTDDELRALIQTCAAPAHSRVEEPLHHRRDEAIIRLMLETAIRAGEVVAAGAFRTCAAQRRFRMPRSGRPLPRWLDELRTRRPAGR